MMDKSDQNIKMCGKAERIQLDHIYKEGDWFCWRGKVVCLGHYVPMSNTIVTPGGYDYDFQDIDYADCIWLPTQAQLQKMLGFETYELLDICAESDGIMWQALHDYANSMEQLWLAFVMKEKYSKQWIKGEWIENRK